MDRLIHSKLNTGEMFSFNPGRVVWVRPFDQEEGGPKVQWTEILLSVGHNSEGRFILADTYARICDRFRVIGR